MYNFLRFALLYLALSLLLASFGQGPRAALHVLSVSGLMRALSLAHVLLFPVLGTLMLPLLHRGRWRAQLPVLMQLLAGLVLLQLGFCLFKNSIPAVVPFHADPWLARADLWLHGGVAPWEVLHRLVPADRVAAWVDILYLQVWMTPGLVLPFVILLLDGPGARTRRYAWLYAASWVGLGSLMALAFSSVGPVYYDRLMGSDADASGFAALVARLTEGPFGATATAQLQALLWTFHLEGTTELGGGISAFPSMHVAMATVLALYLTERSRWLAPIGWGFWAMTLFLSVYTGYHYALDGYVSTLCVCLGNLAIGRLQAVRAKRWRASGAAALPVAVSAPVLVSGAARG